MENDCNVGFVCDGNNYCRVSSNNTDNAYCTQGGITCIEGEGGCINDIDCEGALVCGQENCAVGLPDIGCCTQPCNNDSDCFSGECIDDYNLCRLNSDTIDWSRCSQDLPCADGEGDCDHHLECEGTLLCGNDNCAVGPSGMDCCEMEIYTGEQYRNKVLNLNLMNDLK